MILDKYIKVELNYAEEEITLKSTGGSGIDLTGTHLDLEFSSKNITCKFSHFSENDAEKYVADSDDKH